VFEIEINGSSPPCPPEVLNILNAISAYSTAAGIR
jgi:hypothetical protein